ncbi:MAG: transposase [Rhizomicrobium sp.]
MKRSRFGEEQIIAVLKEHEWGTKTADLCRMHAICSASFTAPRRRAEIPGSGTVT